MDRAGQGANPPLRPIMAEPSLTSVKRPRLFFGRRPLRNPASRTGAAANKLRGVGWQLAKL